jgi:(S)-ureidoglycine aminohydrolase
MLAFPSNLSDFYAYLVEMGKNGATTQSIREEYEFFIYTLEGSAILRIKDNSYEMSKGDYLYLPPDTAHSIEKVYAPFNFFMIKRKYMPAGLKRARFIYKNESDVPEEPVPEQNRSRRYLIPNEEVEYDMGATILKFQPGAGIPLVETHTQHHGIYILSGTCLWYLGNKWYQSEAGDFIWLMPFTPHSIWCIGTTPSSCLLYKNWNR